MSVLFSDTTPEAEAVLIDLLRKAPPWRKLQMMETLNAQMRMLLLAGLRQRHPRADEAELRRRMPDSPLGKELAEEVYGPSPSNYDENAA